MRMQAKTGKNMVAQGADPIPSLGGFDLRQDRSDSGDFIRRVRVNLGMSQETFAGLLGVRPRQVIRWETGRQKPSWRVQQAVQELLAADWVQDILARQGVEPFAQAAEQDQA